MNSDQLCALLNTTPQPPPLDLVGVAQWDVVPLDGSQGLGLWCCSGPLPVRVGPGSDALSLHLTR